ncbi:MAG TPA: 2-dehydropantoate 2-reductase [Anaeromyxobacter sp.]|nr:2-dehydropantoate 2-reductase [Anaeromyxobacter sp.]
MRIAIVGAGGVGGLLGGLLARAGEEVVVLARGSSLEAIRSGGLRVDSPLGRFTQPVAAASDDPAALGPVDAVVVAVKAWQVAEVAPRLRPLLARGGVVVPLQNGVEAAERLAAALGEEPVANGLVAVLAWLDGPGVIRHIGNPPRIALGERGARGRSPSPRLEALAAALAKAGCEARVSDDIARASWEKYLLIEPWGALSAAARAPIGVVRSVPETRRLLEGALEELAAVGRARGVAIPADAVARTLAFVDTVTPEATASMQRDIGAGRPSELDDQTGALVRLARAAGVPVPIHEALLATLLPQEAAARGRIGRFQRT